MPLKITIIDIRSLFNSELRSNSNTSHTRNTCKRRPRHKIPIFVYVVPFAFENKHWFEISFSHTM